MNMLNSRGLSIDPWKSPLDSSFCWKNWLFFLSCVITMQDLPSKSCICWRSFLKLSGIKSRLYFSDNPVPYISFFTPQKKQDYELLYKASLALSVWIIYGTMLMQLSADTLYFSLVHPSVWYSCNCPLGPLHHICYPPVLSTQTVLNERLHKSPAIQLFHPWIALKLMSDYHLVLAMCYCSLYHFFPNSFCSHFSISYDLN